MSRALMRLRIVPGVGSAICVGMSPDHGILARYHRRPTILNIIYAKYIKLNFIL